MIRQNYRCYCQTRTNSKLHISIKTEHVVEKQHSLRYKSFSRAVYARKRSWYFFGMLSMYTKFPRHERMFMQRNSIKEIQKRFWLQSADAPFARGWSVLRGFIPIICRFLKFTREMFAPIKFCDRNNIGHIPWMFYFRWTCLPIIMIKRSASLAERYNI